MTSWEPEALTKVFTCKVKITDSLEATLVGEMPS